MANENGMTAVPFPSSTNQGNEASAQTAVLEPTQQLPETAAASATPGVKPAPQAKRPTKLSEDKHFKIVSGSANRALADEIAEFLGVQLVQTDLQRFSDGEVHFQLLENVRGADVFLV